MPLATCERCGKMFSKTGNYPVCAKCMPKEDEDYDLCRLSLQRQPNQTAEELAEDTGVSFECIMRLTEAGRLENVTSSENIRCGKCGAPAISLSRRLCEACLSKLSQDVARARDQVNLPQRKDVTVNRSVSVPNSDTDHAFRAPGYNKR